MEKKIRLSETATSTRLITKLPEEKDPVICVCWTKEYEGAQFNEDLVDKYKKDKFVINIFPTIEQGAFMNLMLISMEDQQIQRLYKKISYDYHKFHWWVQYTSNNKNIRNYKFCHIVNEHERHRLIKTRNTKSNFILNVAKINILNIDQLPFNY